MAVRNRIGPPSVRVPARAFAYRPGMRTTAAGAPFGGGSVRRRRVRPSNGETSGLPFRASEASTRGRWRRVGRVSVVSTFYSRVSIWIRRGWTDRIDQSGGERRGWTEEAFPVGRSSPAWPRPTCRPRRASHRCRPVVEGGGSARTRAGARVTGRVMWLVVVTGRGACVHFAFRFPSRMSCSSIIRGVRWSFWASSLEILSLWSLEGREEEDVVEMQTLAPAAENTMRRMLPQLQIRSPHD